MTGTMTTMKLGAAVALFTALGALPAAASDLAQMEKAVLAQPQNADAALELGQAYRTGGDIARGVAFLTEFHKTNPPNPMTLVWQGSLKSSASSAGEDMEQRLNLLQSGIADMDKAVRLFPDNRYVRLVRAVTISHFPPFLGMQAKAITDLELLVRTPEGLNAGAATSAREALARLYRQTGREKDAAALGAVSGVSR
jgi:tetratricopeptide (TPR) repeat protein